MPYEGPYLGDEDDDREYETEDDVDDRDLGDDMPEWWDEDMPDDWFDMIEDDLYGWDYEEFEIGIDYGDAT